jgi:hypothetical protein
MLSSICCSANFVQFLLIKCRIFLQILMIKTIIIYAKLGGVLNAIVVVFGKIRDMKPPLHIFLIFTFHATLGGCLNSPTAQISRLPL